MSETSVYMGLSFDFVSFPRDETLHQEGEIWHGSRLLPNFSPIGAWMVCGTPKLKTFPNFGI